jgi:uncharacterized protein (UPF0276 family)
VGDVPVVLERDQNIPDLDGLLLELARVRRVVEAASAGPRAEQYAPLA